MQHISPSLLHTSLPARITYLTSFLELTPSDSEALLAAKPLIAPLVPAILDAVYNKLLSYDITAKAFVPRGTGYEGEVVGSVEELGMGSEVIGVRRGFLKNYLVKLVSTTDLTPTSLFWVYLNNVGIMHTGKPGFKHREKRPDLRVEYIHMGALLGYVVDVVVGAVMEMEIEGAMKSRVIRTLNKVVWIQNDLFARHYMGEVGESVTPPPEGVGEGKGGCPFGG